MKSAYKKEKDYPKVKQKLDNVGCGFCLAKWTQVTIHLGTGINHSCHHVKAHRIDLEELKNNPNALHNTGFKKSMNVIIVGELKITQMSLVIEFTKVQIILVGTITILFQIQQAMKTFILDMLK
jgi:hypothetical protein